MTRFLHQKKRTRKNSSTRSDMEWSPQQAAAIDEVGAWLRGGNSTPQVYFLSGYAGTGKTTLALHLAKQQDGEFVGAAFTGKAASVLRRKGWTNANTIHGLIYAPREVPEEYIKGLKERIIKCESEPLRKVLIDELNEAKKPSFELKPEALDDVDLVVIDEVSMVGEELGRDLLSFGKKILVLGDPAQLPPVSGTGFFTRDKPDFLLTEIHRQARDNPIIGMASIVRQNGYLAKGNYGHCKVIDRRKEEINPLQFDQLICGLNRTRRSMNDKYRDLLGWTGTVPVQGDKIICLKNNRQRGLLNGTHWWVQDCEDKGDYLRMRVMSWENYQIAAELEAEEHLFKEEKAMLVDSHLFDADLADLQWYERKRAEEFDFGYIITCHKSQGSQWKKVFVLNESYAFREDRNRWLYTAITRAEETVVVAV